MAGAEESHDGALEIDPSLLDPTSGLFAQPFFLAALSWRVIACRRVLRPLAFAQLEVVDGLPDGPAVPSDPQVVTAMIRATLRNSDVAARLADGTYGLMLEDTPEDGAVWAVERLRRSLATRPGGRVLRAGVACYPGQALTPTDIVLAAQAAFATRPRVATGPHRGGTLLEMSRRGVRRSRHLTLSRAAERQRRDSPALMGRLGRSPSRSVGRLPLGGVGAQGTAGPSHAAGVWLSRAMRPCIGTPSTSTIEPRAA